jgi:transcription elongation factor Elf1
MQQLCPRCGGLVVKEWLVEHYAGTAGQKCINCGWYRREMHVTATHQRPAGNPGKR